MTKVAPEDTVIQTRAEGTLLDVATDDSIHKFKRTRTISKLGSFASGSHPTSQSLRRHNTVWGMSDPEVLKSKVREKLLRPERYSVHNLYQETGLWQKMARAAWFDNLSLAAIVVNAIWIAIDTDYNKADTISDTAWYFIVAENLFCFYFVFELFVRFMAFKEKSRSLRDGWFISDLVLVLLMVLETWLLPIFSVNTSMLGKNHTILRLFRLLRLSRLLKMLRSSVELLMLVKGMMTAMRSVFYVMVLLMALTFVFAIACTQLADDTDRIKSLYFSNVALSMYSLTLSGIFMDNVSVFCNAIKAESIAILILVFVFLCLASLTIMNMLIGVLCQVINAVADCEREGLRTERVISVMKEHMASLDADSSGTISLEELNSVLLMPSFLKALEEVGVDPVGLVDFVEVFFQDEHGRLKELSFQSFFELVLDLRSSNVAKLRDIMNLSKQLTTGGQTQKQTLANLEWKFDMRMRRMEGLLQNVCREIKELKGQCETPLPLGSPHPLSPQSRFRNTAEGLD